MLEATDVVAMAAGDDKPGAAMPLKVTRLTLTAWARAGIAKKALAAPKVEAKGSKGIPPVICNKRRRESNGNVGMTCNLMNPRMALSVMHPCDSLMSKTHATVT
jgi:hypothetical protein